MGQSIVPDLDPLLQNGSSKAECKYNNAYYRNSERKLNWVCVYLYNITQLSLRMTLNACLKHKSDTIRDKS